MRVAITKEAAQRAEAGKAALAATLPTRGRQALPPPARAASAQSRRLASGLVAIALGLAAVALLGPLVTELIDYRVTATLRNQTIGLDLVSLVVVAPLALLAALLVVRRHVAGPALGLGIGAYTAYMFLQYVLGPDYAHLDGNNERLFPLALLLFVCGWGVALMAWNALDVACLPRSRRRERLIGRVVLPVLALTAFGRYVPSLVDWMSSAPADENYRAGPSFAWAIALLDLGVFLPLTVATCVGLVRDARWAPKALYTAAGWFGLVGPAVAAMAITMYINDDPIASGGNAVFMTVLGGLFFLLAFYLYKPLADASRQRRPTRSSTDDARATRRRKIKSVALIMLGVVGLILLGASVVGFVLSRQDLREARSRLASIPTTIYASEYGDIQYRVVGSGPTVLVSHGITGGVDHAEYLVTKWRNFEERYRFVYVSRFGYLKSSLPANATPRLQAAAYRELLDHLGIERTFVVGNSAGGASAMWFAIDYPERTSGLILLSSAVPGPEPDRIPKLVRENDFVYWSAIKLAPDMLIGLLLPDEVRATLTEPEKEFIVENAFVAGLPISERSDGIRFDSEVSNAEVNEIPFERIDTPTLIFQSTDDPRELQGGREMARRIPNSELIGLTGGHFLLRHEQEIRAANAAFIAEHRNGSR